ncbi:hypothetical protein JTB14_018323 [Gonioctena quinquepunctata]|nr:hypothetical protein JTB14_018323 [Gonioctena quinquepunctata]
MDNLDISKMTSDEAFALLDEETSDQEGVTDQQAIDSDIGGDSDAEDYLPYESLASTRSSSRLCPSSSSSQYTPTQNVHSAPVPSTSSSRPKTLRKIITPRRIRHHQSPTVDLEEPEPYSSDDSLKDPDYSVDKQNKNKKPSHRPAFVLSSESSEVSEEEVIEAEVAPPKVNACNEPGDITAYKWKDRSTKPVIVASNMHDSSDKAVVQRRNKRGEKEDIICPRAIRDYNLHMGGVDHFDQLHSTHNISWKSRRWWMKLFFYFLDAAVVSSYIMYKTQYKSENHASKCMTHLQFRSCLIDQLIGTFSSIQKRGRPIDEEGTGRKNNSRYARGTVHNSIRLLDVGSHLAVISTYRRCAFCSTKQKQKRSNLVCKACNVALCKKCFDPFHQNGNNNDKKCNV